ncbi:hypothetical protein R75461_08179 [Paraburkholderia nemoris]|uniref:hypothetical protein n=1 Tax=Paraburkholderia nemoris TaxID=2793076 RepID=UPI00190CDF63|nr:MULTISPECIES: hypothetical protein [Paraburkholderia]MBK3786879.1 hypothetical protein [Paraburkholderia aspalathi]CAE6864438.1 hypothetical protein R75461_08179 [Paraburkholderia nemoris]
MSNAYLDVRAAFALAKVASITHPSTDRLRLVLADAQALGYRDAAFSPTSQLPVPVYFADEPRLAEAWHGGVATQESEEETSGMCSFCFKGHEIWQCPHLVD